MNRVSLGLLLLIAVLAALAVTILLTAPNVRARQLDPPLGAACAPYETAIKRFAAAGWRVLDDFVRPGSFQADRFIVGTMGGSR